MTDTPFDRYTRLAKDLRKAHEAGGDLARQRLAAHPPREPGVTLKHADYLHVIAQEHSYATWPAMKLAIETHGEDRAAAIQRLKIALYHGQTEVVEALLAVRPDLAADHFGLQVALYDLAPVTSALAADVRLATQPHGGRPALIHLAGSPMFRAWPDREQDMLALADLLLENGADVNSGVPAEPGSDHHLSPLYFALGHAGNLTLARWLLENGAKPDDNESLYHATELGHRDGVRLLLEFGADPKGTNALPRAIDFDDAEMVRMLLDGGADPNEMTEGGGFVIPALHQAARRICSPEIIDLLMSSGADPTLLWRGKSAYTYACAYGHADLRRRIEAMGAVPDLSPEDAILAKVAAGQDTGGVFVDPAKLDDEFRDIIRHILHLPGKLPHIKRLVAVGVEFDRVEPVEKLTPVQVAGWEGLPDVMSYLLSLSPDLSHVNGYGGTLLSTIIHGSENCPQRANRDHVACAELALKHGVALPKRAIKLAGAPAMAEFLADWAKAHPGSVVTSGVA